MEKLTQVHHAAFQGTGSGACLQMGHEDLGWCLVSKAFARLMVEMARELDQVSLLIGHFELGELFIASAMFCAVLITFLPYRNAAAQVVR